jgi:hypothetical protein
MDEDVLIPGRGKWKCECGNVNHAVAKDCASCGRAHDEEDLISLHNETENGGEKRASRDAALRILRKIRPEVASGGTDTAKSAWNALYVAVRDGDDPQQALRHLRGHFRENGRVTACDSESEPLNEGAANFVAAATAYLGRDIREAVVTRRTQRRSAADEDEMTS